MPEWSRSAPLTILVTALCAVVVQDNKCLFDYNVQNRVDTFVQASRDLSSVTYGDDVLIPFGSDFQWVSAHQYYKNVDKLIHYVNEDGRINAFYSTPAEYVAVKSKYNHSWPLKTDDFFPYADCPVCYWTGQRPFPCPRPPTPFPTPYSPLVNPSSPTLVFITTPVPPRTTCPYAGQSLSVCETAFYNACYPACD